MDNQKRFELLTSTILQNENAVSHRSWMYEDGVVIKGLYHIWKETGNQDCLDYIQRYVDTFVTEDGRIPFVEPRPLSLDNINNGKCIFMIYDKIKSSRYENALHFLWNKVEQHPRNPDGGLWHKVRYPGQMWLDGLYMAHPFSAEYAKTFHLPQVFDDIALQFRLIHKYTYEPDKGLYYHACDCTKKAFWCDKETGRSPNFWGRAMGWLGMAAVDCLDYFPDNHPGRADLIQVLQCLAAGLERYQDKDLFVWYQVTDKADVTGNYPEMSCSTMYAYTLYKASQKGYIDSHYKQIALSALDGIWNNYVNLDVNGKVSLLNICQVAGLGPENSPERDGSFSYYINEPVIADDNKGVGPLLCLLSILDVEDLH